jgi:hypothetical protein
MSFLQPLLLIALPLALLPVIIHLIHLHRRRAVRWAAMMFLRAAQRMNQGLSRLRQYLILALRVLAVAALILMAGRPLAGGLLGLTGGAPDTVLLLIDRSASMEQQNLATGLSKRATGLANLASAIDEAYGARSRFVVIDSATLSTQSIENADTLRSLPTLGGTATATDVPALLQTALDHITTNQTGRTDVWLLSDLRQNDWDATGGRWEALRAGFSALQGIRFHLLSYPEPAKNNLALRVERVTRRATSGGNAELLLDLRLTRPEGPPDSPLEVPLRVTLNGTSSTLNLTLKEKELSLQAHSLPLDQTAKTGWGQIELPADTNPADNHAAFVFGESPALHSIIVTSDEDVSRPLKAALSARLDPSRSYTCDILPPERATEIDWETAALIVWQAPIPQSTDLLHSQLAAHAAAGRSLIFLPSDSPDAAPFAGLHWQPWITSPATALPRPEWWRNDSDLLANTQAGSALPVGDLALLKHAPISGTGIPLARLPDNIPLLVRSSQENAPHVWFLGTLPGPAASSLARDGVVQFALLHRALDAGSSGLGNARSRAAGPAALAPDPAAWTAANTDDEPGLTAAERALRTGVFRLGEPGPATQWTALNRPALEDQTATLSRTAVEELFTGLDARYIEDTVDDSRSLASEIWRTFLLLMAAALLLESLLCLPSRKRPAGLPRQTHPQSVPAA